MSHYRIYLLDGQGRIASGRDADCVDDEDARVKAAQLLAPGRHGELWTRTRYVGDVTGREGRQSLAAAVAWATPAPNDNAKRGVGGESKS